MQVYLLYLFFVRCIGHKDNVEVHTASLALTNIDGHWRGGIRRTR